MTALTCAHCCRKCGSRRCWCIVTMTTRWYRSRGRELAAKIPAARYVSLPSANHLMMEDEPAWAIFLKELGLFLNW